MNVLEQRTRKVVQSAQRTLKDEGTLAKQTEELEAPQTFLPSPS